MAGAIGAFTLRDPNVSGSYGFCPFLATTGWDCPFCGGLRGTYALLHGDVAGALDHNVLLPLLLVGAGVVGWLLWWGRMPKWVGLSRGGRGWIVASVVVLVVFWVVRNLPGLEYLRST